MRVTYKSECGVVLVADVLRQHFEECLESRTRASPEVNRRVLRSVLRALEEAALLTKQGYVMTEKERQNTADDVGIWFSYEVAAGRATFVPTEEV